ncbi:ABC transporter permease [Balneatrix alpica]|uniref:ABC transporter permease n=1 Tax=Balneatrix alpica TaxID=75684 RepID=A0ABV5ZF70_9GAMM|nr:ABC transporter permease [Balneatrix alpica]
MQLGLTRFNWCSLAVGLGFLYLPILILILYSFNESKLVTVWGGFSLKWYGEMFNNERLLNAAWLSVKVAIAASTLATILGTLAGFVMARFRQFPGRTLFSGMIFAPMVMPEIITGLALLLTFVALGIDRGQLTVTLAHASFSFCFVAVIVQSRLADFDISLEEAALDLGCRPFKTFMIITLPLILPAIISGWLLSFALSMDDLVIASFATGPGATTLPMQIYSQVRLGVTPEINAISTILIGIVATGVVVASYLQKRQRSQTFAVNQQA